MSTHDLIGPTTSTIALIFLVYTKVHYSSKYSKIVLTVKWILSDKTLSTQLDRQVRHCPLLCNNADENPQFSVNLSEDENESVV